MKVLLNFLDLSLKRLNNWFLNLGLSPEDPLYCQKRWLPWEDRATFRRRSLQEVGHCDVRQEKQDESRCCCRGA
eukprot:3102700-Pleurochrysis_carterae.AAC.1